MGQNASAFENKQASTLRQAAKHGHRELIVHLLRLHPSLLFNASWPSGFTALHHAARKGQTEAVAVILAALEAEAARLLAKRLHRFQAGNTPFTRRTQMPVRSQADVVQQLLDAKTTRGCTALMLAAHHGHCDVLQLLLEAGADALMLDRGDRRTALHHAAMMGHADAVRMLLNASVVVNQGTAQQRVALASAQLRDGSGQNIRYIDAHTRSGLSALHLACCYGCTAVVKALISGGASLQATALRSLETMPCDVGCTALHLAALRGHTDVAVLLLQTHVAQMLSENAEVRGDGRYAWEGNQQQDPRLHLSARQETPSMLALEFGRRDLAALLDPLLPISWLSSSNRAHARMGVPKLRVIAGRALHHQLTVWLDTFQAQQPVTCSEEAAACERHTAACEPSFAAPAKQHAICRLHRHHSSEPCRPSALWRGVQLVSRPGHATRVHDGQGVQQRKQ